MRNSNKTQYKYDPVDNILGISNVITPKAPKKPKGFGGFGRTDGMGGPDAGKGKEEKPLGGAFSHTYAYDELNRLVKASGKAKGIGYGMDMSFGLMGEPLTKVQRTDSGSVAGSYALAYEYGDADHPTAPSQIGHERYTYDANGNPTLVEDDSLNTERRMAWDEENRLTALSDNGKTSRYTYNAAGERIVKSHGYLEGVYINGAPQGLTFHETEDYTIYPAPILSVTRQRFTKHYFIGDRRVASKIGAGIFQNAYGHGANVVTAGQKDYQMRMMQIERQREDYYRKLGTPPGVPTMKGATAEPENTHEGYNSIIKELGDHSVPDGWIQRPKRNAVPGTPPGPPVQWDKAEDPDDVQPGYGYVPADTAREDIFYYHTDHLGSTSYITDAKANVAQFDAYLPYGELLVDEHSSTEEMPYKFNGKEFDQETGLYYYGARYMNPRTSLWYGVDPLAEKYPSIDGYVYCAGNPVKFIDVQGLDLQKVTVPANKNGTKFKTIEVDSKIAAKVYTFSRAMNKKYGVVVTSAFRSRTKQQQMRANWDKGQRAGLKARPAKKSAHSGGFALDFNISAIGLTKANYKQKGDLIKELTEFGKEYGFEYGAHFKNNPDLVHFYGNETDYGYKSRDEAIDVNDTYKNKHGDNIPLYTPEPSNDTPKTAVAVEQHQKHEQKKSNKE